MLISEAQLLPLFTTTVRASKARGSSMKVMPFSAQALSSLLLIGREALAIGISPAQNWRRPPLVPTSLSSTFTSRPRSVLR